MSGRAVVEPQDHWFTVLHVELIVTLAIIGALQLPAPRFFVRRHSSLISIERAPATGLIPHSATAYRELLNGMIQSMSRKGNCYDYAVVESFFSNLKNELTWHRSFATRDEARCAIFDYIELFYNRERLHETLDYVSPVRYEENPVVA